MCDKTKFSKICLNFFLTSPPRETKQNEKWLLLKNSSWMLDISADTWQICGCRDYKWLRVQAVAEKHFQCRLCIGRREDCGSIGKRCAKLRMLHIFSDIETQTGCLQNSRTPRTAFVCRRSQKWKNLILQIPWIWNACVLMHCCSHMSWICNILIKNIFNTWKNPPLGSFYWGKCCKKYFFRLKILFECDQWPFYAELREGTRCDERRRTKGQQSRGARSAHCFLVHPPTLWLLLRLSHVLYLEQSWCSGHQTVLSLPGRPCRWRRGTCTWFRQPSRRSWLAGLCSSTCRVRWHWWHSFLWDNLFDVVYLSNITFSSAAVTCKWKWMKK